MKPIVIVTLLLAASSILAKDKINPADYPESATVLSAKIITTGTGVTIRRNPACDNPEGAFMKGFCAQSGTQIKVNSKQYVQVVATIGNNTYTLMGDKMPPPGPYKARFLDNGDIELMGPNPKGELHAHRFKAIAIEVTKPQN